MDYQIRELRRELSGAIEYSSGCGEGGRATWLNISRTGAALRLGRYLRPGRQITLLSTTEGGATTVPAEIAWCVPIPGTMYFRAGLRINRDNPEVALHIATLGQSALLKNKTRLETVTEAGWPSLHESMTPRHNADVSNFTHAV